MLLANSIFKTNFKSPIKFKSGIQSPIYGDVRSVMSHNTLMGIIQNILREEFVDADIDCVIGVATGAISYASIYGHESDIPAGYIRPDAKAKDYGAGKLIEGCDVSGKKVLLIEDLVSTGESVLQNAKILKDAGAKEILIATVFTYRMKKAEQEFAAAGYDLFAVCDIQDLVPILKTTLSPMEYDSFEDWLKNPADWFTDHKTEFDLGYLTSLRRASLSSGSIVSFGIDPVLAALPKKHSDVGFEAVSYFMQDVFSAMKTANVAPSVFKLNRGFYEVHDDPYHGMYYGSSTMVQIVKHIRKAFPGHPIILDNKMGDIGKSSQNYADAMFKNWKFDAATVAPYMGTDSIEPFAKFCNSIDSKAAYVLCCTSNSGSNDLQKQSMQHQNHLYELTADLILKIAKNKPGVGAVVGATSPDELLRIASKFAGYNIPLLVPGIGSQGGSLTKVLYALQEAGYEKELVTINSSSGLTHPWYKDENSTIPTWDECVELVVNAVKGLNEEISSAMTVPHMVV